MALKSGLSSIKRTLRAYAALLIEERGVLVAGDMLSDALIPMLDFSDTADPVGDYLTALRLWRPWRVTSMSSSPATGPSAVADQLRARIDQDRAYVHALRDAGAAGDPRVGPSATDGWDWVAGVHERQLQQPRPEQASATGRRG